MSYDLKITGGTIVDGTAAREAGRQQENDDTHAHPDSSDVRLAKEVDVAPSCYRRRHENLDDRRDSSA